MANFFLRHIFSIAVGVIIFTCIVCVCVFSGFRHETEKFKTMLLTMLLVLMFNYLVGDVIMLTLEALFFSCCKCLREGEPRFPENINRPHSYTKSLRNRLISMKEEYRLPWKHRDERLNIQYRAIQRELFIFVPYFLMLLLVVIHTRDQLLYYNTYTKEIMLENRALGDMGLSDVERLEDVYTYMEDTLINGFHEGRDYRDIPIAEPGWLNYEVAKLVGVVRLRQLRFGDNSKRYLPGWKEPYVRYHYLYKYWRIYGPWLPLDFDDHDEVEYRGENTQSSNYEETKRQNTVNTDEIENREEDETLLFTRQGELGSYSQHGGYATVLARNRNNSLTVTQFLQKYGWLNSKTAALFIDFTLFNVDANMFTVVSLMMEQTPFGDILLQVKVHSCKLLIDLNELSYGGLMLLVIYLIVLLQFAQALFVRLWQQPCRAFNGWNVVDIMIVLLNISIVPVICVREKDVLKLMERVGEVSKLEFVDFRAPAQLDYLLAVLIGFLVCLTTLRIWRIMQFARVFRLFTTTLSLAKWPLLSSALFISVVLFSFSISSCIINGSQSESFSQPLKSIRAGMSVAIGIGNDMGPQELSHGGITLGMLQYTILMIMVAIVLINMFITLIIDYFTIAKELSNKEKGNRLNFFEFMAMEFSWVCDCVRNMCSWFRCCCRAERKRTFVQRMEAALDKIERKQQKEANNKPSPIVLEGEGEGQPTALVEHELRVRKVKQLAEILRVQMELMKHEILLLDIEEDWDEEAATSSDGGQRNSTWLSKNAKLSRVQWKKRWKFLFTFCI